MVHSLLSNTNNRPSFREGVHFSRPALRAPVDRIILHHTGGTTTGGAFSTLLNAGLSYHYLINENDIHNLVSEQGVAHHAGNWAMNQRSIGISAVNATGAPNWLVSAITQERMAQLIAEICTRRNIPINRNHILAHRQISATSCPGGLAIDWVVNRARELANTQQNKTEEEEMKLIQIVGRPEVYSLHAGKLSHVLNPDRLTAINRIWAGVGRSLPIDRVIQAEFDQLRAHLRHPGL